MVRVTVRARVRVTINRRYADCADLPPAVTLDGEGPKLCLGA